MADLKFEVIYQSAYGYQLRATVEEWNEITDEWETSDISSFTATDFKVEKPDGTTQTVTGSFETDGTDGILVATVTQAMALLNLKGHYTAQAILSNASQYFPTSIIGFDVDDPI